MEQGKGEPPSTTIQGRCHTAKLRSDGRLKQRYRQRYKSQHSGVQWSTVVQGLQSDRHLQQQQDRIKSNEIDGQQTNLCVVEAVAGVSSRPDPAITSTTIRATRPLAS